MQRAVCLCWYLIFLGFSGCYSLSLDPDYLGPEARPASLLNYYQNSSDYGKFSEKVIENNSTYKVKKVLIESKYGDISLDLYLRHKASKNIILVFPILKGKPIVESHFASYFVEHGIDAAIVGRNSDFMNPENSDKLETVLRDNVIKDTLVIDFLEEQYSKSSFGSFGLSRGAINAAVTAGADPRLKHNIFVLGGSDIPKLFEKSDQKKIKRYVKLAASQKKIAKEQLFEDMRLKVKSDPKFLAPYIDARHTLLVLGLFDRTVPIRYGNNLRDGLGKPKTIYLMADHYVSLAFTQTICSLLPDKTEDLCPFPFDYVETEALNFYRHSMDLDQSTPKLIAYRILSSPFELIGRLSEKIF